MGNCIHLPRLNFLANGQAARTLARGLLNPMDRRGLSVGKESVMPFAAPLAGMDRRESPRFNVPLYICRAGGNPGSQYGDVSLSGVYFETEDVPEPGECIEVRLALIGLRREIDLSARVVEVIRAGSHAGVLALFEAVPFDTERSLARWLDLMVSAHGRHDRAA
jgi:hypothetical protein